MPDHGADGFDYNSWFAQEILPLESGLRSYLRTCFPSLTSDADDVVQESFVRVSLAKMSGTLRSPKGLLFRAARNAAITVFRRGRHAMSLDALMETDDFVVAEDGPDISERASRHEEADGLAEAIKALPCRCRQVVELCKLGGLSHKEIGVRLGISARTVNVQVGKGVSRCAEYLEARGFKPPPSPVEKLELPAPAPPVCVRRMKMKKLAPKECLRDLAA